MTGAAGQVGSRLVRWLLARNHEVRATVWSQAPSLDSLAGLDIDVRIGELRAMDFVAAAVRGMDAVVHAAALVGDHFANNVEATRVVVRACSEAASPLQRFVYVSSSAVFPNDSHVLRCAYHPVDELHPKRATNDYSLSKIVGEQITEMAGRSAGLRYAIVRPSHVLSGEAILAHFTVRRVVNLLKAGQLNRGSELFIEDGAEPWRRLEEAAENLDQPCLVTDLDGRPWYYQPNDARDVAHGVVCALEHPQALGESFNLGAPEPFPFTAGGALLGQLSGRTPLEVRLPMQWRYDHCIAKARSWLGYQPRGDLETMMRSGWACRQGDHLDWEWEV